MFVERTINLLLRLISISYDILLVVVVFVRVNTRIKVPLPFLVRQWIFHQEGYGVLGKRTNRGSLSMLENFGAARHMTFDWHIFVMRAETGTSSRTHGHPGIITIRQRWFKHTFQFPQNSFSKKSFSLGLSDVSSILLNPLHTIDWSNTGTINSNRIRKIINKKKARSSCFDSLPCLIQLQKTHEHPQTTLADCPSILLPIHIRFGDVERNCFFTSLVIKKRKCYVCPVSSFTPR